MGLNSLLKVPQVQLESVKAAIVRRGLDPATFELSASTDLLSPGPIKSVIKVSRRDKSATFERTFDAKWVDDFRAALERGDFD